MPQLVAQAPIEQTRPAGHIVPHMPQLARSACSETHVPLQLVCPDGQTISQRPAVQA
jgi:hypothetical protein